MIASFLVAVALAGPADLVAEYPDAKVERARGAIVRASGFAARGLGETCATAAASFLERFGQGFGVASPGDLRPVADAATTRAVFERLVRGLPVFERAVTVQCDARGAVVQVTAPAVAPAARTRFHLSRRAAIRTAITSLGPGARAARGASASRGWYPGTDSTRPAWRVDVAARRPAGSWRVYVDAVRGDVLFKQNRRLTAPLVR